MYDEEKARIDALLFRQYLGELTAEEEEELNQLLLQHPEAKAMQEAMQEKIRRGVLDAQPALRDTSGQWATLHPHLEHIRRKQAIKRTTLVAAASIVAIIGIGSIFYFNRSSGDQPVLAKANEPIKATGIQLKLANGQAYDLTQANRQVIQAGDAKLVASNQGLSLPASATPPTGWNELTVPAKMDYAITLPDGSKVRLNSATRLRFPLAFTGKSREVYVEGEAYFTIAANASQPFIVHTSSADVQVLGTEFNINTYQQGKIKTALVNGAVAVAAGRQKVVLQPGKEAVVNNGENISIQEFESRSTLSWMKGIYFFYEAPVEDIARMIERWFDIQVVIDDPELNKVTFTGHLDKKKELDLFLTVLSNTGDIYYRYEGKVLHLSK
ncbi:FecR family protein [Chitinophaga pinensis]|uniref:Anti-FecI sigma factor, FecR n=1 Tax=Chitinophaga pinensis (strain ATCC 43595 / DSM 2588 / LMG 13176 / NBRC 15968 / NCIMB 11800 / UQM 2034) TaxID=485918 RepID=A0A979G4M5_CHIPD|nr:FecR domain-containing protein [Chitinophaga pinensis]ACU60625.1 anti-FecI sigma factor, FecR [Chitinophaga pinensis DSM 2588]